MKVAGCAKVAVKVNSKRRWLEAKGKSIFIS
jgi:hypothetical protein